jgi:CheY-like chemotaxis protein/signal transduction histidine kinase
MLDPMQNAPPMSTSRTTPRTTLLWAAAAAAAGAAAGATGAMLLGPLGGWSIAAGAAALAIANGVRLRPETASTSTPATPAAPPTSPPAPPVATAPSDAACLTVQRFNRDLRGPLTSLLAATQLLQDTSSAAELATHTATIRRLAEELGHDLDDLDDLERLQRAELGLSREPFDLPALLAQTFARAAALAAPRGIDLRTDLPPGQPRWVTGDARQLRRMVDRMLESAIEATTIGPIHAAATRRGDELDFVVQDRRADDRADAATGLAMTFCRELGRAMGGSFSVETRPELGLLMRLRLPLRCADADDVAALDGDCSDDASDAPATKPGQVRGQVLLVEDSRDQQRLLAHLLERAGAQVTVADHGAIALHLLTSRTFDLVLLDMHMPELDGYATARELRHRGVSTPVVAITADTLASDAERCLAAGCNGHLAKPVDRDLLHRLLGMYLPPAAATK